jgi:DNA polymerase III alpha subunit
MNINDYGSVFLSPEELFDAIYSGKIKHFQNLFLDKETSDQFNKSARINRDSFEKLKIYTDPNINLKDFDLKNQSNWFMPEKYKELNISNWLLENCSTDLERTRVSEELILFSQHDMLTVLQYLKYLVDVMRENNILWGVGRGSSVSSYCLYLIGIHKINSIKYNLDIDEFLKKGD